MLYVQLLTYKYGMPTVSGKQPRYGSKGVGK